MGLDPTRDDVIQTLVASGETQLVNGLMRASDLPFAVIKGAWLAELWRRDSRTRTFGDVDVLVSSEHRDAAISALTAAGYVVQALPGAELPPDVTVLARDNRIEIDLQTHVLHEPELQAAFTVKIVDLLGRTRQVRLDGNEVTVLDAADNLIVVSLHALRSDALALKSLVDVHACVTYDEVGWDEVVARAGAYRCGLPLAVMLDRATWMLGTRVPRDVRRQLAPVAGWRGVLALASRYRTAAQIVGGPRTGGKLFQATRHSTATSIQALAQARAE